VHPSPDAKIPPAATVEVPTDDTQGGHWASIWPHDAYVARISGHVILQCGIDRYGLAGWCQIASETPPHKGFGQAALEMRPLLKLAPPGGPDAPAETVENIAIDFKAPEATVDFAGPPPGRHFQTSQDIDMSTGNFSTIASRLPEKQAITMLDNPVWASAANFADVETAYPAKGGGAEGYAVDHCQVDRLGRLSGCQVIKEAPEDHGFGQAALALAAKFRVSPESAIAPGHTQLWTDIPIRFPPPGEAGPRMVRTPNWVAGFDPAQAPKVFPPEAAEKGFTTGWGVAECNVIVGGGLADCHAEESDPDGVGFAAAAARLASTLRMNPWTADGAPVDGATVLIKVRLNLSAQR
jgi:TonB family protein